MVENEAKLQIFMDNKEQLPKLKAVIVWAVEDPSKLADFAGVKVVQWSQLAEIGAKVSEEELDKRTAALQPGNVCTYIYTSGTTGNPKAVMISHDNIIFSSTATLYHLDFLATSKGMQERVLSFLPLSHVAGVRICVAGMRVTRCASHEFSTLFYVCVFDVCGAVRVCVCACTLCRSPSFLFHMKTNTHTHTHTHTHTRTHTHTHTYTDTHTHTRMDTAMPRQADYYVNHTGYHHESNTKKRNTHEHTRNGNHQSSFNMTHVRVVIRVMWQSSIIIMTHSYV